MNESNRINAKRLTKHGRLERVPRLFPRHRAVLCTFLLHNRLLQEKLGCNADHCQMVPKRVSPIHQLSRATKYNQLLHDNITKTYKKAENNKLKKIDEKAKTITEKLRINNRVETMLQEKPSLP